ncbi:unnamed protein product [Lactuca virosa]|uniref:Uncharacterized protein n=1 Tax=Lactuca virosa TaxID=75947 RepID=A0AAU9PLW1_9ASTR|nr:unnamed protein product [Lactuca virosa]
MVTLVMATTTDPTLYGPATTLSAMENWNPGVSFHQVNGDVRLLEHDKGIVEEDHLDNRWEEATCEVVDEIIFLSKHTAVTNRPALTNHPIGFPHLKEGHAPPQGGKPGWAAIPNPRMTPWLILLKKLAQSHNLVPEFEVLLTSILARNS